MKKFVFTLVLCVCLMTSSNVYLSAAAVSAESACVLLCSSGEVLYEKNMNERRTMASTTKIMTALLAVESGRLSEHVTVGDEILTVEGTSFGLEKGDTTDLYNLVLGMMLSSGNDAANAVAAFVGGSMSAFIEMMNAKAAEIGMNNTSFAAPSGLDAEGHYSSAYDMALLARFAMENDEFRAIAATKSCSVRFDSGKTLYAQNHNKLFSMCEGCTGIKTGFTKLSGRCLVSACERSGARIIAVTLNAPDDWNDHLKLYDEAFGKISEFKYDAGTVTVDVVGGNSDTVELYCPAALKYYASSEQASAKLVITHDAFLYAPVEKDSVAGFAALYINGTKADEQPLLAKSEAVKQIVEKKETLFERIRNTVFRWIEKWMN